MQINPDHWLGGVFRNPILGGSEMRIRRFLVIHFTGGWSGESSISSMRAQGLSAHLVIDRDGSITQCRAFNRTCGHAGESDWHGFKGLNACSIGIELANCGDLVRATYPSTLPDLSGKKIPRLTAPHKNGGSAKDWEIYPAAQLAACEMVSRLLVDRYNLDDVVGHEDIAPKRKTDPGPAFPLLQLREACGFTGLPKP